jgi:PKD repeat protein
MKFPTANSTPTEEVSARPASGIAPLEVSFDGSGSSDPDGDPLNYTWNFGDESAATMGVTASHTYTTNGPFDVRLVVDDQKGGTDSATLTIPVGNPPVGSITAPREGTTFSTGDTIQYAGVGTDPEDGALPASAFSWSVRLLHHPETDPHHHFHPFLGPIQGVKSGSFQIPNEIHDDGVWYRIYLTVTDSDGLIHSSTRDIGYDPPERTAEDIFTGTDSHPLDGRTATGTNGGFQWEVFQGNGGGVTIGSNALVSAGNPNTSVFRANLDLGRPNHSVQFTLKSWDEGSRRFNIGVVARKDSTDTQTYYWAEARADNGNDTIHLFKRVAGVSTELDSASVTFSADDVIKLVADGTNLKVYHNSTEVIDVTDTSITHGNFCGLFRNANGTRPTVTVDAWYATSEF